MRVIAGLVCAAVVAAAVAVYVVPPGSTQIFPRCLLYTATGYLCPGCGGTRAAHLLMHGDVLAALRSNVIAVAFFPVGAWLWFAIARFSATGSWNIPSLRGRVGVLTLVAVLSFTVLRNFTPFGFLRP